MTQRRARFRRASRLTQFGVTDGPQHGKKPGENPHQDGLPYRSGVPQNTLRGDEDPRADNDAHDEGDAVRQTDRLLELDAAAASLGSGRLGFLRIPHHRRSTRLAEVKDTRLSVRELRPATCYKTGKACWLSAAPL